MSHSPKSAPIPNKSRSPRRKAAATSARPAAPVAQGLYDPFHEHDSCGVGFIVQLKGQKSHKIIDDGLTALEHLNHRGACGCEINTGDGAGVTIQLPHDFFAHTCAHEGIRLPEAGHYGAGLLFASRDKQAQGEAMALFHIIVEEEGQHLLGWRKVPTNNASLGATALAAEPDMYHVLVGRGRDVAGDDAFERKLYVIRKRFEIALHRFGIHEAETFYFPSLSSRTLVYKGMLMATQLREYFPDLSDPRMVSALCMFHSRFSTNTFPSWKLAHPYRMISHNGEINTLRGNINWMRAREGLFESELIPDIQRITPIIDEKGSDTACFDNALELLTMAGRPIHQAVMMMIPEPWDGHESMSQEKKDFYRYHGCLMEPWDGPASIAFTDGRTIGAVLDRNGLRPSRYYVTKDDYVIMASEVGVLPIAPENVAHKGRLQPGRMFLVSLAEGRIVADDELKHEMAASKPYGKWLAENMKTMDDLPYAEPAPRLLADDLLEKQMAFGYSVEDLKYILGPMARNGEEAIGSMGTDTPLAVLSDKPQLLYNYFKQLFAQVTNPPLDAIREQIVTSVGTTLGPEGDLLDPEPENARMIEVKSPFLSNEDLA
ncbi:MAG: glutamate synthase central domain-containing protein, partial [Chloroflexota bacterium]